MGPDDQYISFNRGKDKNEIPISQKVRHIRLPGFIIQEEVGLGDIIKKVTYRMGIESCEPCKKRAEFLNRRFVFSPKKSST
jgi:hypothetical protein